MVNDLLQYAPLENDSRRTADHPLPETVREILDTIGTLPPTFRATALEALEHHDVPSAMRIVATLRLIGETLRKAGFSTDVVPTLHSTPRAADMVNWQEQSRGPKPTFGLPHGNIGGILTNM
jgi:hypothetical protein